jgi:hypothetical protein
MALILAAGPDSLYPEGVDVVAATQSAAPLGAQAYTCSKEESSLRQQLDERLPAHPRTNCRKPVRPLL